MSLFFSFFALLSMLSSEAQAQDIVNWPGYSLDKPIVESHYVRSGLVQKVVICPPERPRVVTLGNGDNVRRVGCDGAIDTNQTTDYVVSVNQNLEYVSNKGDAYVETRLNDGSDIVMQRVYAYRPDGAYAPIELVMRGGYTEMSTVSVVNGRLVFNYQNRDEGVYVSGSRRLPFGCLLPNITIRRPTD